jgi:hypothetical protein
MGAWEWFFYGAVLWSTVSPAELTWTLVALAGIVLNVLAVVSAQGDLRFLRAQGLNGARTIVARGHRRGAAVRGGVKVMFVLVGLTAASSPPPILRVPTVQVLTIGFILAVAGLTWVDLCERIDRARLLDIMDHRLKRADTTVSTARQE